MSKLPFRERAKRYRAQAWDARLKAVKCTGELQLGYVALAGQWETLAKEADNQADEDEAKS